MINFHYVTKEITTTHKSERPYVPDHPYRIVTTGSSESEKKIHSLV